jgi:glucose dehydrogenase
MTCGPGARHVKYGDAKRVTFKTRRNGPITGTAGYLTSVQEVVPTVSIHERQIQNQLAELPSSVRRFGSELGHTGCDYANQRWSDLKQIDAGNVGKLQVAWTLSTGVLRGHEGSPLVIGDTMYIHTPFPNNVYAVSLKDQTFKWKYEPKQDADVVPVMCFDTVSRGLAYGDGKIFLQQADTTLRAGCWDG